MIRIKEWMSTPVITIESSKMVTDAARLMDKHEIGGLPVLDNGKPVGILTERDIIRRVVAKAKDPTKITIAECMTKEVITIDSEATFMDVSKLMYKNYFRRLIIIKGDKIVGIITAKDIIRILSQE